MYGVVGTTHCSSVVSSQSFARLLDMGKTCLSRELTVNIIFLNITSNHFFQNGGYLLMSCDFDLKDNHSAKIPWKWIEALVPGDNKPHFIFQSYIIRRSFKNPPFNGIGPAFFNSKRSQQNNLGFEKRLVLIFTNIICQIPHQLILASIIQASTEKARVNHRYEWTMQMDKQGKSLKRVWQYVMRRTRTADRHLRQVKKQSSVHT